jgi:hypothetical protein
MYRLPRETDLSFLLGAELLQVCVGMNEVILHFDREIRITVMADFAVARGAPNRSGTTTRGEARPICSGLSTTLSRPRRRPTTAGSS